MRTVSSRLEGFILKWVKPFYAVFSLDYLYDFLYSNPVSMSVSSHRSFQRRQGIFYETSIVFTEIMNHV